MSGKLFRALALGAFGVLLSDVVCAKPADDLQHVEQALTQEKQKQAALDQTAKETSESLRGLRTQLIAATTAIEDKAEEEEKLEDRLDKLKDDIEIKSASVKESQQKLGIFTRALIDMARQPLTTLFLKDETTKDFIHRNILTRALIPNLAHEVEGLLADLAALHEMQADMAGQRKLVAVARINLQKQQHDLDQLIRVRQGTLKRTESEKAAIAKQLATLSSEAKDLRQLLEKITPKRKPKSTAQAPSAMTLKWPVSGSIIRSFGQKDADGVVSSGTTLGGLPGSPVVAPRTGKIVFTGPFRGYGQILILQHDGGYHSFLAGFGRIDVEMGQEVETGEPLGVLPTGDARRYELYFEWRRNNEPIAPK